MRRYEVQLHDNTTGRVSCYSRVAHDAPLAIHSAVQNLVGADRDVFTMANADMSARVREWPAGPWEHFRLLVHTTTRYHAEVRPCTTTPLEREVKA